MTEHEIKELKQNERRLAFALFGVVAMWAPGTLPADAREVIEPMIPEMEDLLPDGGDIGELCMSVLRRPAP